MLSTEETSISATLETPVAAGSDITCENGHGKVAVTFGPHGFKAVCSVCGNVEHFDDMLEPLGY